MKKLNHYFQKVSLKSIVLILVTTMLLTIPRMNVYSVVGNYQKSSTAITANNYYLNVATKEKTFYLYAVAIGISTVYAIHVVLSFLELAVLMAAGVMPVLTPNSIEGSYAKDDFSQFDNTIVR